MMLLRARVVAPICKPPIPDGALLISGHRVTAIGRWRDLSSSKRSEVVDLGEVILLPGLVNAHCHLDYTLMAGQLPPPKVFSDWLKVITSTKAGWGYSDYAESWLKGARMLVRTGTTTVGDIEAVPQLLPDVWSETPLRVISFLEMIGITSRRPPVLVLGETLEKIRSLRHERCRPALSPHAPYSTVPELLRLSAHTARRRQWLVCTHVAESAMEFDMFARAKGEMFDWLQRSGRDTTDCGLGSPVQHLERCGLLGANLLAAHANYLAKGDAELLGRRLVHVVHCPRSHSYFNHEPFPWRRLARAGVNLCLGTDSLASVYQSRRQAVELSMFEEMRALALREPALSPAKILRMATVNGARALGLVGKIGELSAGAFADLIAVPFTGEMAEVGEALVHYQDHVRASMIAGQWALAPAGVRSSGFSRSGPEPT
jgi:aminodeoxyfutalosine deaminase